MPRPPMFPPSAPQEQALASVFALQLPFDQSLDLLRGEGPVGELEVLYPLLLNSQLTREDHGPRTPRILVEENPYAKVIPECIVGDFDDIVGAEGTEVEGVVAASEIHYTPGLEFAAYLTRL